MIPCPICQHSNPAGAKVCQSCGSPLGVRELGSGGFGITYKALTLFFPVLLQFIGKEFF